MLTLNLIESCNKLADAKTVQQADQAASQILETLATLVETAEVIEESIQEFSQC